MTYENYTATELADALKSVLYGSPENTSTLSMLDQATLRWAMRHPELADRQRAFSQARHAHWPGTRSNETWGNVLACASELSSSLRELGDVELALCQEQTGWGTCNFPFSEDGHCPSSSEHVAPPIHGS